MSPRKYIKSIFLLFSHWQSISPTMRSSLLLTPSLIFETGICFRQYAVTHHLLDFTYQWGASKRAWRTSWGAWPTSGSHKRSDENMIPPLASLLTHLCVEMLSWKQQPSVLNVKNTPTEVEMWAVWTLKDSAAFTDVRLRYNNSEAFEPEKLPRQNSSIQYFKHDTMTSSLLVTQRSPSRDPTQLLLSALWNVFFYQVRM